LTFTTGSLTSFQPQRSSEPSSSETLHKMRNASREGLALA
jgi:hypothetical protein